MIGGPTLRVEREVLGPIRTFKDRKLLDLLQQLLEEVVPGGVRVQQAAGEHGPPAVFKPAQEQEASVSRYHQNRWTKAGDVLLRYLTVRVCVGSKSGLLTSSSPAARASSQHTSTSTLVGPS